MMRRFSILSLIAVAALSSFIVLPACSQNDDIVEAGSYTIEISAFKGSAEVTPSTRALTLDGDYLGAPWVDGETVSVFKANFPSQSAAEASAEAYLEVGTLTAQSSDGYTTKLVGKLTGTFKVGDQLMFSYRHGLRFDYRGQKGTLEYIAPKFDYAIAFGEVSAVGSGTITVSTGPSSGLYFSSMQAIFKFSLKDATGTALEASKLVIQSKAVVGESEQDLLIQCFDPTQMGVPDGDSGRPGVIEVIPDTPTNVFFVALAAVGENAPMGSLIDKPFAMTATVGEATYTYTKESFSFDSNKYYVYDVKMTKQE